MKGSVMANDNVPIREFQLDLTQLSSIGEHLARPESVLTQRDGTLWTSEGMPRLPTFRSPVASLPIHHWEERGKMMLVIIFHPLDLSCFCTKSSALLQSLLIQTEGVSHATASHL